MYTYTGGDSMNPIVTPTTFNTTDNEIEKKEECEFCLTHEKGDTLFDEISWDGGIGFDYIRNIKYCPLCGKELVVEQSDWPRIQIVERKY